VVPKPVLTVLVYALPILVVAYGVLMGGATLAGAVQDAAAAVALKWIAAGCLLILVMDLVLLVGALGVNALARQDRSGDDTS
jgi:hypothetical protein